MSDVAHLGPVEVLTPEAERSLAFFVDVLGMEIEGRDGGSVYLRGWGDYQRYSLVLTEAAQAGMAWLGLRASSPEALRRCSISLFSTRRATKKKVTISE